MSCSAPSIPTLIEEKTQVGLLHVLLQGEAGTQSTQATPAHTYSIHTHPLYSCQTRTSNYVCSKLLMFFVGENSRFAEFLAAISILSARLPRNCTHIFGTQPHSYIYPPSKNTTRTSNQVKFVMFFVGEIVGLQNFWPQWVNFLFFPLDYREKAIKRQYGRLVQSQVG
jgi:hypothetical protein